MKERVERARNGELERGISNEGWKRGDYIREKNVGELGKNDPTSEWKRQLINGVERVRESVYIENWGENVPMRDQKRE